MLKRLIPNDHLRNIAEWILILAASALLYLFLRTFLFRTATVSGNSMEPTLNHGDWALLSRVGYRFAKPKAGQIVAFPYKENKAEFYVKRIAGVQGDVVDFYDHQFYVNGELLDDEYSDDYITLYGDVSFPLTVPEDSVFVLGDNRNYSKDSRFSAVGCVEIKEIVGKVVLRLWPLKGFGLVN